ncbi:MAG: translation initiation factor IF-2, partial [Sulfolobales archaeon]
REKNEEIRRELDNIYRPGKIRVLPGYVFRRSEPAIVGVEVLGGVIRPGYPLMREDGKRIGIIMQIQERGKALDIARTGSSVAISIRGNVLVGRHFDEGDILYTDIPEKHAIDLVERFWNYISDDEKLVLKEIVEIKRKVDKTYALSIYLKLRSLK